MKVSGLIIFSIVTGLTLLYMLSIGQNLQSMFIFALLLLVFLSKDDLNGLHLVIGFLGVFLLGKLMIYFVETYIYPNYNGLIQNSFAFGTAIIEDIILIYLVKNRMNISVYLTRGKSPTVLEKNYVEGPLLGLLIGYILIDLLAFFENIIRNLEHFGVSEVFAQQFWNVTFFYDFYEYFKVTLISLTIAVLYMGVIIRKRQSLSAA